VSAAAGAVFLDRDGLLNDVVLRDGVVSSPRSRAELSIPRGAPAAILRLADAGFALAVVTNQPDLSRGLLTESTLDELHTTLTEVYGVRAFFVCPHDRDVGCTCRKPAPGLLLQAAEELSLPLDGTSWTIGDRWVDVVAGRDAGVRTALLERPWSWHPAGGIAVPPVVVPDVADADLDALVDVVLGVRSLPST
jgi:D-glycero-D-manno-heptose 1,7-bisphosphate phosphatase